MSCMRPFKIGLLGCGMIAEKAHLPHLKSTPGLQLEAVYDIDFARAVAMQKKFLVPHAYPTEEEFWKSDLDAVVICTPAPVHFRNVQDAARHGKHVLCEKPLAMNESDIETMIDIMRAAKLHFFAGFNYRFSQSSIDIHRLIRENAIGEVRALRLVYIWHLHGKFKKDEQGSIIESPLYRGRMLEGGPLVDCGVHQIDLARWWLGSEVHWQRGIGVWVDDYEAPDHMYLHMGHECGAHTMVEVSFTYSTTAKEHRSHFQYDIIGTDGVIRYNREEHTFELRNSHGTQWLPWHPEKNFAGLFQEFARVLASGQPGLMPTGQDGLIATRIARLATEQAIHDREQPSQEHHSTKAAAANIKLQPAQAAIVKMEPIPVEEQPPKSETTSSALNKPVAKQIPT